MSKQYEFIFLTGPKTTGKEKETIFSDLEKEIKDIGGKVKKKEDLGIKYLAFEIKDNKEACFYVWHIQFEKSPDFDNINLFINRGEKIIRYLFLKKD